MADRFGSSPTRGIGTLESPECHRVWWCRRVGRRRAAAQRSPSDQRDESVGARPTPAHHQRPSHQRCRAVLDIPNVNSHSPRRVVPAPDQGCDSSRGGHPRLSRRGADDRSGCQDSEMTTIRRAFARLGRRLSGIRSRLLGSRSRAVPAGPATGLRLGTEAASADYLGGANEVPVQEAIRDGLVPGAAFVTWEPISVTSRSWRHAWSDRPIGSSPSSRSPTTWRPSTPTPTGTG